MQAFKLYRNEFEPSEQLDRPYAMCGITVVAGDTDVEARRHFTSIQQSFINLRRGRPGQIPPPIDDIDAFCPPARGLAPITRFPVRSSAVRIPWTAVFIHSSKPLGRMN